MFSEQYSDSCSLPKFFSVDFLSTSLKKRVIGHVNRVTGKVDRKRIEDTEEYSFNK